MSMVSDSRFDLYFTRKNHVENVRPADIGNSVWLEMLNKITGI